MLPPALARHRLTTSLVGLLAALAVIAAASLISAPDAHAGGKRLSHHQAAKMLRKAHIDRSSSGGCSNRQNSTCTSYSKIRRSTVRGIIAFKRASGCHITITGGTEVGHAPGTYSHYHGYKVDVAHTGCVTRYIHRKYASIGGGQWRAPSGNIYYDEGNHWDITYYRCGC